MLRCDEVRYAMMLIRYDESEMPAMPDGAPASMIMMLRGHEAETPRESRDGRHLSVYAMRAVYEMLRAMPGRGCCDGAPLLMLRYCYGCAARGELRRDD